MAVLHEHELHYRCSFELISAKSTEQIWVEIVRLVRSWIASKFPANQALAALDGKWFRVGGEWHPPKHPRALVKTEGCVGGGSDLAPQWWALRLEHSDAQINVRHWRTDLGLTSRDDKQIVFSISVIHWLSAGYIGQEPPDPLPSAPRIVLDVLKSKTWEVHSGSEKLETIPFLLRDGNAKALVHHLEDQNRGCPLVLVAKDFATGESLVDPRKLARLLAGAAVVWESESSWVDKELEQLLGRPFSCWNGMVRAYQPKVNLNSPQDARRHRYFDKGHIETLGVT